MAQVLERELKTFEEKKAELLSTAEGRFALIHESELVGTFNDEQDAIREGYTRFGNVPFLVKKITPVETAASFVNSHIAF